MIRGVWHRDTVGWLLVAAVLPSLGAVFVELGTNGLVRFALSLVVIFAWQAVFLVARAQPVSPIGVVTAVAVTLLAPGDLALWQLVLALSFGAVIGEGVFGGWGRNVLSAPVVTLAFLYFGFPETLHEGAGPVLALAALPGAAILLAAGILSWRVLAAVLVGLVAVTALFGADLAALPLAGSLVFGLVFLVGDPVASAATRPGRWAYGLLAGGLAGLFGWAGTGIAGPQTVVFATLVASLFAPLIDHAAIAAQNRLRRRRLG